MRRIVFCLAALTAFAVAGCSQSSSPKDQKQAAGPVTKVTGTVALLKPHALSGQATLNIKLIDASTQSTTPLATRTISPVTKMPVQFTLNFTPADVNRADLYVIQASMTDGERHFTMPVQAPVLTKGASNHVSIHLVAQATPDEKMMTVFKKVKANLGAMRVSHGTSLAKDVSRGWQTFRDKDTDEVALVRELADYGDKGYTKTDYAYKDGKPWVVEQTRKPSEKGPTTEVDRAGWDADGKLVLKDKVVGGKTSTLADADAATLKQQAAAMYAQVNKGHKSKVRKGKM